MSKAHRQPRGTTLAQNNETTQVVEQLVESGAVENRITAQEAYLAFLNRYVRKVD